MQDDPVRSAASTRNGSPALPEAGSLVGRWTVKGTASSCTVTFAIERIEAANAHQLDDPDRCLARLLGQSAVGWRPATDGIDFAGSDRLSVGFFSFQGEDAVLERPEGPLTLARA